MNELSVNYTKAQELDRRIKISAQLAQQSLYEMCMGFKEMRDSKLYKELGYNTFEDYCEKETGFTRVNVYRYISIAENLPQDFVTSRLQIGVKKLTLLSKLSEEERTEITEKTDLENTTVRELEQQIKQIRAEKDKAVADKSAAEAKASAAAQQAKSLEKAKNALSQQIAALEAEIKELENRPVEVAVAEPSVEDIAKIRAEAEAAARAEYDKKLADEKKKVQSIAHEEASGNSKEIFKIHLKNIQREFNEALELVSNASENERSSYIKAFRAALNACGNLIAKL